MKVRNNNDEGQSESKKIHLTDQECGPIKKMWLDPELQEMSVVNTVSGNGPDAGSFSTS